MKGIWRWLGAGLVTIAAFAAATWLCGALILPYVLKDPGVRWVVSAALGGAVGALAALWGNSFAEGRHAEESGSHSDSAAEPKITRHASGSTYNMISGGTFFGKVIQGGDISGAVVGDSASETPKPADE